MEKSPTRVLLENLLNSVKKFVDDSEKFKINDVKNIEITETNQLSSLVFLRISKDFFENCERNIVLGLNMRAFNKMLRTSKVEDVISLEMENQSTIIASFQRNEQVSQKLELNFIELDTEPDYSAKITMSASNEIGGFSYMICSCDSLRNTVKFTVAEDMVAISSVSALSSGSTIFMEGVEMKQPVSAIVNLKQLRTFCKDFARMCEMVNLYLTENSLLVEMDSVKNCKIMYLLKHMEGEVIDDSEIIKSLPERKVRMLKRKQRTELNQNEESTTTQ